MTHNAVKKPIDPYSEKEVLEQLMHEALNAGNTDETQKQRNAYYWAVGFILCARPGIGVKRAGELASEAMSQGSDDLKRA